MSVVLGDDFVLVLRRTSELDTHELQLVASVAEAVKTWHWSTRISPVYACKPYSRIDLSAAGKVDLAFVGPLDPVDIPAGIPSYLTFGTYNVLLFACTAGEKKALRAFLKAPKDLPWERWQLNDGRVVPGWKCSPFLHAITPHRRATLNELPGSGLKAAAEENGTLLAAAIAKSERYFPKQAQELEDFSRSFQGKLLKTDGNHEIERLGWLVNVNAHLSRYTSQTFSGTTPVAETECHFWTHSLLGVGTATEALVKIRRFVQQSVALHDPIDRLDTLRGLPAAGRRLLDLAPYESEWTEIQEQLKDAERRKNEDTAATTKSALAHRTPLVVCFSGRDGFRSTPFSLSAPLEVISCCNTYGWTPMTLTHEMCHVWVTAALGKLFPNLEDPKNVEDLAKLRNKKHKPANLFEDIRKMVYWSFMALYFERHGLLGEDDFPVKKQPSPEEIIESENLFVNELLTHVMDFQMFYAKEDEIYVQSIWSSWDVIPNIKDRLMDYLVRSACALLSARLQRNDPKKESLDRLETLLVGVSKKLPKGQYLTEAIKLLKKDRQAIERKIAVRLPLVRFAQEFLCMPSLALALQHEFSGVTRPTRTGSFDSHLKVQNPLLFMRESVTSHQEDRAKSMWMLQHLAFSEV